MAAAAALSTSDVEESNDARGSSNVNRWRWCGRGVIKRQDDNDDVIDLLDNDLDLDLTPQKGTDIDDDDYVDIDTDSEDKARTSVPKNKKPPMNLIIGGPQPTDTTGMTAVDPK